MPELPNGCVIPDEPRYINDAGQPVFYIEGAAYLSDRPTPGDVRLLVIHHSGGTDSRGYLWKTPDGRQVSTHYLVGKYKDVSTPAVPRVYKYASETTTATWTQGFGSLGGLGGNPNSFGVSIEIEGPPIDPDVFAAAATLAASIIRYWRGLGKELLLIRHRDLDKRKIDPTLDWTAFCQAVYALVEGVA